MNPPGVGFREWVEDTWGDWRRIACGAFAVALVGSYDERAFPQLLAGLLAYLIVGALDDLGHLIRALHDCVHEAADEAAIKMLRASDAARAENLEA